MDFAVEMAQKHVELTIIEMMINDMQNLDSETVISEVKNGDWSSVEKAKVIQDTFMKIKDVMILQKLEMDNDYNHDDIYSESFADKKRWGLKVTSYHNLFQMDYYLQGLLSHFLGRYDKALELYTESLEIAGQMSNNDLRLACLQNISLIVNEKQHQEKDAIQQWSKQYSHMQLLNP